MAQATLVMFQHRFLTPSSAIAPRGSLRPSKTKLGMWVHVTRYALHCLPRLAMTSRQGAAYRLGGRELNADLQPHWRRLLVERFGAASAADCSLDEDWRGQYEEQERQLSEKAERIKAKVQGMFEEVRQQKQQRCAQVHLPATWMG